MLNNNLLPITSFNKIDTWSKSKPIYDPVNKCKSSGIIPYTYYNNTLFFLLQTTTSPQTKKNKGWNDFGGRQTKNEHTFATASREFSEETSCLFYVKECIKNKSVFNSLKNNDNLIYSQTTISKLKNLLYDSQIYFTNKLLKHKTPLFISNRETYISFFVKVVYISEKDIPTAEDIHVDYDYRYSRSCKWFTIDQLLELKNDLLHKRLQTTNFKNKLKFLYTNNYFI